MNARIHCELGCSRRWSLRLDAYIIAKMAWIVFKGENASLREAGVTALAP